MAVIETWIPCELKKPVQIQTLCGSLFSNNGNANRIGAIVTEDGEPASLSGTVSGYAVLSDGTTVPCTGTLSNNKASILLPAAAYLPGSVFITVFITSGTTVTTLAAVSATVLRARTDSQVDPGSVVTDWTTTINTAMQAVETAAENLGHIVATPYASLTFPVPLGKHTYYNNNLYRCITPIATSEDFTAAHWSAAINLGDELRTEVAARENADTALQSAIGELPSGKTVVGLIGEEASARESADAELKSAINATDNQLDSLEEFVRKTIVHEFSITKTVASGNYSSSTKIVDADIPSGQAYTVRISSTATRGGNITIYEMHTDNTSKALTYNASVDTDLSFTAEKDTNAFNILISGGGFTSSGTVTFTAKYSESTSNSIESRVDAIEDDTDGIHEELDDIYIDYVTEEGYDLIPYWENGDIDTSTGAETSTGTGSYYRTPAFAVDASKYYLLTAISKDSEGTRKSTRWSNNTYGLICCYSDSAYLGIVAVGTGANSGLFTPLANTTKIRICHALVAATNLHVYELKGTTSDDTINIIPSDHEDTVVKTINTDKIDEIPIDKDQIGFLSSASDCILDKSTVAPWYLFGSDLIVSDYFTLEPGKYMMQTVCTGLTGSYIRQYDENKAQLRQVSFGNYQTPIIITIPSDAKYLRIIIGKSSIKLSDITSFKIYRYITHSLGYGANPYDVINVSDLPALPPLALAGQVASGIMSFGHGGASSLFAEDSIESFYALARNGFNGAEVDIQFTKDHVPVCWHDGSLSTLEGGTSSDHIYDYTLAELDANFDFRTWYNPKPYLRSTVARFEEVCILARAYGWWILPDKLTSASGSEEIDANVLINMIKKYGIQDRLIVQSSNSYLRTAFPNNPLNLTAMQQTVDEAWINGLLNNNIPEMCHQDGDGNYIVDDQYTVYTCFNWAKIKEDNDVSECADITDLMTAHNVKTIWYTCESPEDIYQLVTYCPKTAIVLTGAYTVPDGMNEYIGIKWSNMKFDLSPTVHQ